MILTTLRFMEGLDMKERIFCSDTDFQTALTMVQVLLRHTAKVFETLPSATAINLPTEKTEVKQKFLDALPSDFGRDTMLSVAKSLNLPQRSAERYVQSFCKDGKLVRASHGSYRKP